jgi:hypothetical protein
MSEKNRRELLVEAYEYYLRGVDLHGQHKFPMAIKMLEKSIRRIGSWDTPTASPAC